MKKLIKLSIFFFSCLICINNIFALEVSETNIELKKGENKQLELYTTLEENCTSVSFNMTYTSYDIRSSFTVNSMYTETDPNSNTHEIVFTEPTSGRILLGYININTADNPTDTAGTINLTSPKAFTESGETYLNVKSINVSFIEDNRREEPKEEKKCDKKDNLLSKIESSIIKLELKKNKYEYEININKDIEELDLKGIPKEDTYKVEISNQKINELEDKKITIKVSDECNEETYTIKINITEDNKIEKNKEISIDKTKYKPDNGYKNMLIKILIVLGIILVVSLFFTNKKKR